MRKTIWCLLLLLLFSVASIAVPAYISFQGVLKDSAGSPITGMRDITFAIYPGATGGGASWSETQTVTVEAGLYNVKLGSATAMNPATVFDGSTRYLSTSIGGSELLPRVALLTVPHSFRSDTADNATHADTATYADSAGSSGTAGAVLLGPATIQSTSAANAVWVKTTSGFGVYGESDNKVGVYGKGATAGGSFESTGGDGVNINATLNGVNITNANNGVNITNAGNNAVNITNANNDGVNITNANGAGVNIARAGGNGITIASAVNTGVYVSAEGRAIQIQRSGGTGVHIADTVGHGVDIVNAGGTGVNVQYAGGAGVNVTNAGGAGVDVVNATGPGVQANSTSSNGGRFSSTNSYGVFGQSANSYAGYFDGGLGIRIINSVAATAGLTEEGTIRYDNTAKHFYGYTNTGWKQLD